MATYSLRRMARSTPRKRAHDFAAHVVLALDAARHDDPVAAGRGTWFQRRPPCVRRWLRSGSSSVSSDFRKSLTTWRPWRWASSASALASRTSAPSFSSRIAWYVPPTIFSPSLRPLTGPRSISRRRSLPLRAGRSLCCPFRPRTRLRRPFCRLPSCGLGLAEPAPPCRPSASASFSRTVSAMIGIDSTLVRVSVTTLAVAEKSGRVSVGGVQQLDRHLVVDGLVGRDAVDAPRTELFEIFDDPADERRVGERVDLHDAPSRRPRCARRRSRRPSRCVSSTDMSLIVSSVAASLLNVPGTAVSPCSTTSRVTRPLIGA